MARIQYSHFEFNHIFFNDSFEGWTKINVRFDGNYLTQVYKIKDWLGTYVKDDVRMFIDCIFFKKRSGCIFFYSSIQK